MKKIPSWHKNCWKVWIHLNDKSEHFLKRNGQGDWEQYAEGALAQESWDFGSKYIFAPNQLRNLG